MLINSHQQVIDVIYVCFDSTFVFSYIMPQSVFNDPHKTFLPTLMSCMIFCEHFFGANVKKIRKNHFKGELDAGEAKIGLAIMLMLVCTLSKVSPISLVFSCLRPSHVPLIMNRCNNARDFDWVRWVTVNIASSIVSG